jgi:hypothetical protein
MFGKYIVSVTYVGISIRYSSGKVISSGVQKASIGTCPSLTSTLSCSLVRCLVYVQVFTSLGCYVHKSWVVFSLVVVFGANTSGCWKFELSGAGL